MFSLATVVGKAAWGAGFHDVAHAPANLDAAVYKLARGEALARLELGRAAARFSALRGWEPLGFSRLGDYARERLGISGRELSSFAFVATRLAELPRVGEAFAVGELSWSATRLLCSVADGGSESAWLVRARRATASELAADVCGSARIAIGEMADAIDEVTDSSDGEPRVCLSVPCPGRIAFLWRRAIELARRMLGSQAPVWQAAEAIVAEASSEVAIEGEEVPPAARDEIPPLACRSAVQLERHPREDFESLDVFELDEAMRDLVEGLRSMDFELGAALRRIVDLRLHRALGFGSFDAYVRERVGISPAKGRALVAVERRAQEAPALRRALRSGELSWVKALAILPVMGGEHASAWVARAEEIMVRRLNDEVEWALDMRDAAGRSPAPPEAGERLERPDLQTCAAFAGEIADRKVTFFGPASVVGLFRAGVRALTDRNEPSWKGLERLLLHAIAEWEAQPRHRDPIFARDGWRCAVPGCTGRRSLEDHHIVFRSRGGGNEQWNRLAVCAAHHHHAVHRYVIRASGYAPDDVTWELGLRPGRPPLLRLHGERYLPFFDN